MAYSLSSGLTIENSTFGMSVVGIERYRTEINHKAINETKDLLRDYKDIAAAISKNWNGASAQKFVNNFDTSIEHAIEALNGIKDGIDACINAAKKAVITQDNEMIEDGDVAL